MRENYTVQNVYRMYNNNDQSLDSKVKVFHAHAHAIISFNNFQLSTSFELQERAAKNILSSENI